MKLRAEALRGIQQSAFDLCVIGGGATGAGCALDAQLRGLRTVLLERDDFASGASGASTKLIHGGVRYLEQAIRRVDPAEFAVVRRGLRERIRMMRNAPFLTRELEFVAPCANRRELLYLGLGLKLYDRIAGRARLGPSRCLSRRETAQKLPVIAARGLAGGVSYLDGQFDDVRYNMALVETFCAAGGEALNHARVAGFEKDSGGRIAAAEVLAWDSGATGAASPRRFAVRARAFLNATGPGADEIRAMASRDAAPRMRPSKGVHIVLPAVGWPEDRALLIPRTEDDRVLFAIPWQGRLLVGATDEEIGAGEEPRVTQTHVEYLLRHINRYLHAPVSANQVASAFAGVRPLVTSGRAGRAAATKRLARDHEVEMDSSSGLLSIMGGKWTTYRAMAEDAINAVQSYLARSIGLGAGAAVAPCPTRDSPLAGSQGYTPGLWRELMRAAPISEAAARRFARGYGSRAPEVLALAGSGAALAEPLAPGSEPLRAEVVFAIRCEMAHSIDDILARRLGLEHCDWRAALAAAPAAADLLAQELAWPPSAAREALAAYVQGIHAKMRSAGLEP
ncbi:MAG TPA: glycerol-3-phosphate dehydrogenase/oxidase [Candidatus Acidoferrales bacterium]|nr:glycerol-3-phosphate dehydrogenase/oxidase [Candidatus Acidoferrales bacterium]